MGGPLRPIFFSFTFRHNHHFDHQYLYFFINLVLITQLTRKRKGYIKSVLTKVNALLISKGEEKRAMKKGSNFGTSPYIMPKLRILIPLF